MPSQERPISRRDFLRTVGAVAGTVAYRALAAIPPSSSGGHAVEIARGEVSRIELPSQDGATPVDITVQVGEDSVTGIKALPGMSVDRTIENVRLTSKGDCEIAPSSLSKARPINFSKFTRSTIGQEVVVFEHEDPAGKRVVTVRKCNEVKKSGSPQRRGTRVLGEGR